MTRRGLAHLRYSLETRLVLAVGAAVLLAIFVTGTVFVFRDRQERRGAALDSIASATLSVSGAVMVGAGGVPGEAATIESGSVGGSLFAVAQGGAPAASFRVLQVDGQGQVVGDPEGSLTGTQLSYPAPTEGDLKRGYVTWSAPAVGGGAGVMLLTSAESLANDPNGPHAVAAIDTASLTADWLASAPQLALSALVGLPVALLVSVFVTGKITLPLQRLTQAAEAISKGDLEQHVEVAGRDEVATLARSFTTMAGRVKQRDTQLRDLLANVSHDLRTPLTSIQGYAEALADGVAERHEVDRAAQVIRDEARHAGSILANILSLSEIDAGEAVVRREPVDLAALVERCITRVDAQAQLRGLEIRHRTATLAPVACDAEKVERALSNLLDNATKFARTWIEAGCREDMNGVTIWVSNDGPSIPLEHASRIFDRFYRPGGRGTGTGLGLAIARELIELQGGSLCLRQETSPVQFVIALPAFR